ncbi:hypothetical protein DPMN_008461 [Dreissena polymorpha]|uniref:Uncharacterized protein n=1 Tax=Dreissena polymorpha TaxID=45954 RepID=A0A9D4MXT5_DREPO|nr:hypothetical protein DPMN_008461 [Dreissena polymorpha]
MMPVLIANMMTGNNGGMGNALAGNGMNMDNGGNGANFMNGNGGPADGSMAGNGINMANAGVGMGFNGAMPDAIAGNGVNMGNMVNDAAAGSGSISTGTLKGLTPIGNGCYIDKGTYCINHTMLHFQITAGSYTEIKKSLKDHPESHLTDQTREILISVIISFQGAFFRFFCMRSLVISLFNH